MTILHRIRDVVGSIPRATARREAAHALAKLADCRATQEKTRSRLLALNADSDFSLTFGLHGELSAEEFARRFPISKYEMFRPAIERLKLGDHTALLGAKNRLLMFSLSSGTTSTSKYIPITEQFLAGYRRGWNIWGIHTLDAHPTVNRSTILQIISDYDRFRTPGGTPCGNISGLVAAMQKKIVRTMFTIPREVSELDDFKTKYYTIVRLALADPYVGMLSTANPSTLIEMAKLIDARGESLIREIADGTIPSEFSIPDELQSKIGRRLRRPNRKRAKVLEQIAERSGHLYPQDFWPNLSVLAVWTGGSARAYLPTLRRYYGDIPVRDHGLHASEGRMTIPIDAGTPAGILDIITHYFEFIPEAEYGTENPTVLQAHELEEGKDYFILLTTASGLCRYDISDVVRCTGHYGTTPKLEFLHKGAHISNVTGEKISESQVVEAVDSVAEGLGIEVGQFTLTPVWGEPPAYRLLIERGGLPSSTVAETIASKVDRTLKSLNCEYEEKRSSGRLAPIDCELIPDGTWQKLQAGCAERIGGSLEQYKHPCLVPSLDFRTDRLARLLGEPVVRTPAKVG